MIYGTTNKSGYYGCVAICDRLRENQAKVTNNFNE